MMGVRDRNIVRGITLVSAVCRWRFVKLVESRPSSSDVEGQRSLGEGRNNAYQKSSGLNAIHADERVIFSMLDLLCFILRSSQQ